MVANRTFTKTLRLANRTAEFPGLLQALPKHTGLTEILAISILAYVQKMPATAQERQAEYTTRLTARLTAQGQDTSVVTEIVAIAEDLDLFASEPTP